MRTARELRTLDTDQLHAEVARLRKTVFELRNKVALKQLDKPHELKATRRELAKALTVLKQQLAAPQAPAAAVAAVKETA